MEEEESERGQRRKRLMRTRGGRGRREWGGLAWRGWPCVQQVERGEAVAVLGHERNRFVGHVGVPVGWWCGWWVGGR